MGGLVTVPGDRGNPASLPSAQLTDTGANGRRGLSATPLVEQGGPSHAIEFVTPLLPSMAVSPVMVMP